MPEPDLSVIVPLYNEQENIPELHRRLGVAIGPLGIDYELVFVNDGSRDDTPRMLDERQAEDPHLVVLHLSRNFGHQAAVSAGIDAASGQAVLVMDGDLQDPPEVIPDFLAMWRRGHDVVYAVRQARKEGWFKKLGCSVFYRLMNAISDLEIPLDSGDFGLMDRRVVDALKTLPERKRFVRGLRTFVGFHQVGLAYQRAAREAGRPKYTPRGLINRADASPGPRNRRPRPTPDTSGCPPGQGHGFSAPVSRSSTHGHSGNVWTQAPPCSRLRAVPGGTRHSGSSSLRPSARRLMAMFRA